MNDLAVGLINLKAQRFSESIRKQNEVARLDYALKTADIQIVDVAIPLGDDPHFFLRIRAASPKIR